MHFISNEEPPSRGAVGMKSAVEAAFTSIGYDWQECRKMLTSCTTDGESSNTGKVGGLWTLLGKDCPNMKIFVWCCAHRSSLAVKSTMASVMEIQHLLRESTAVSSWYRVYGARTKDLKDAATEIGVLTLAWPEFKEVRLAEFS
jgi:hypothetical protein